MPESTAILVTGAGGRVGGIGRAVVTKLRSRGLLVRALVHREDERAAELRATGAEVVSSATYRSNGCFAQLRRNIRLRRVGTTDVDVPIERWRDEELRNLRLPDHVFEHIVTMARLHAANRYDRMTHDVE